MPNFLGIINGDAFRPDINDWRAPLSADRIGKNRILYIVYQEERAYSFSVIYFKGGQVHSDHYVRHGYDLSGGIEFSPENFNRDLKSYANKHNLKHAVIAYAPSDIEVFGNRDIRFDGHIEEFEEAFSADPDSVALEAQDVISENSLVSLISHPSKEEDNSIILASQQRESLRQICRSVEKVDLKVVKCDLLIGSLFRKAVNFAFSKNISNCDIYLYDGVSSFVFSIREKEWGEPDSLISNLSVNIDDEQNGVKALWVEASTLVASSSASKTAITVSSNGLDSKAFLGSEVGYQQVYVVNEDSDLSDTLFDSRSLKGVPPTFDINPNKGSFVSNFPANFLWISYLSHAACIVLLLWSGVTFGGTAFKYRNIDDVQRESDQYVEDQKRLKVQQDELLELSARATSITKWADTKPNLQYHVNRALTMIDPECYVNRLIYNYEPSTKRLSIEIEMDGDLTAIRNSVSQITEQLAENGFVRFDFELPQTGTTSRTYKGIFINRAGVDAE